MRADGTINSLTTGVSTVDQSLHKDRDYMQLCVNMRNDQQDGLRRRPPAQLRKPALYYQNPSNVTKEVDNFRPDADIFKHFEVDGERYWLYADTDNWGNMAVFDKDGNATDLTIKLADQYLYSAEGNDSIQLVTSGDTVFVVNKNEKVLKTAKVPEYRNHSMLAVKVAPIVYQSVAIKWRNPDLTQSTITYEIGEDHPQQPIEDIEDVDTGVNTTASLLAQKIRAQVLADGNDGDLEIDQEGATIVFRDVSANPQEFSNVSVEDGTGGAIAAINGEVDSILDLPRFAHPDALITVKPDPETNRGQFYMQAETVLESEGPNPLPSPEFSIWAGNASSANDQFTGFADWQYGVFGSCSNTFPIPGFPSQDMFLCYANTDLPIDPGNKTTLLMAFVGPDGEAIPGDTIQHVEFWDDTGPQPVRVAQFSMSPVNAVPSVDGQSNHSWEGTVNGPLTLETGKQYKVYFADQVDNFTAVPEVKWREQSAPGEQIEIDSKTMPHILYRTEAGDFEYGTYQSSSSDAVNPLEVRSAGDDKTNPFPSFVDDYIKDVATFQNRLAVLVKDKVSMSVTNRPEEWFRGTVTQLLDTSPINIQSTAAAASRLEYFVPHNNDLMVFGPRGQFRFDGRIALTPSNASLPQAATYPSDVTATAKSAGNDVFFPTTYGESAGLSQFSLDPQIDNLSIAKPMADMQIGLMPGAIQQIVTAPNTGVVFLRMDSDQTRIYTLEFEPQIDILKPLESAWAWWQFDFGVQIITMTAGEDFLEFAAVGKEGEDDDRQLRLYRMDMNSNRKMKTWYDIDFGDIHLECRAPQPNTNTSLFVGDNYPVSRGGVFNGPELLTVVQGADCPNPGAEVLYSGAHPNYTLLEDMQGGTVFYGYNYASSIVLPKQVTRDRYSRNILTEATLRITDWQISMTGHFDALVGNLANGVALPVQEFRGKTIGPNDVVGYNRDVYRVQCKTPADDLLFTLQSSDWQGMDLHQAEWRGTYNKRGRRI